MAVSHAIAIPDRPLTTTATLPTANAAADPTWTGGNATNPSLAIIAS